MTGSGRLFNVKKAYVKRKVSRPKKSEDVKRLKDPSILLELKIPFRKFLI